MTLQINTLDALERLIGNNTQIETDIRNNVVNKFAEKHLKPLVRSINSEILARGLDKQVNTYFDLDYWNKNAVKSYSTKMQELVSNCTKQVFEKHIQEEVKRQYEYHITQLEKDIKQELEKTFKKINVESLIADQILKLVNSKLKS